MVPLPPATGESTCATSLKPSASALLAHLVERLAAQVRIVDVRRLDLPVGSSNCGLTSTTPSAPGAQAERQAAQHVARGDEADVDGEEVERPSALVERQLPPVDALERGHARVGAQRRMQLAVPDVDREHVAAPCASSASVKPPVDAPTSIGARAAHRPRSPKRSIAASSFPPARLTAMRDGLYPSIASAESVGHAAEDVGRGAAEAVGAQRDAARARIAPDLVARVLGAARAAREARRRRPASEAARPTVASAARVTIPTRKAPVTTGRQETPCSHMICAASSQCGVGADAEHR